MVKEFLSVDTSFHFIKRASLSNFTITIIHVITCILFKIYIVNSNDITILFYLQVPLLLYHLFGVTVRYICWYQKNTVNCEHVDIIIFLYAYWVRLMNCIIAYDKAGWKNDNHAGMRVGWDLVFNYGLYRIIPDYKLRFHLVPPGKPM